MANTVSEKSLGENVVDGILCCFCRVWVDRFQGIFQPPNEALSVDDRNEFLNSHSECCYAESNIHLSFAEPISFPVTQADGVRRSLHSTEGSVAFLMYGPIGVGHDEAARRTQEVIDEFYERFTNSGTAGRTLRFNNWGTIDNPSVPTSPFRLKLVDANELEENDKIIDFNSSAMDSLGSNPKLAVQKFKSIVEGVDVLRDKISFPGVATYSGTIEETSPWELEIESQKPGFEGNDVWLYYDPDDQPMGAVDPMIRGLGRFFGGVTPSTWFTSVTRAESEVPINIGGQIGDTSWQVPGLSGRYLNSIIVSFRYEEFK